LKAGGIRCGMVELHGRVAMSVWAQGRGGRGEKVTVPSLVERKRTGNRISAVTAYDVASGRLADEAGLDVVLVGDSLAMTMLGHENTLAVTMEEMLIFTRAVRRGVTRAMVVADMPYGSYQVDAREGVRNAVRFVKEAGAEAVKLEGGRERAALVERLVEAEVPVMGHLGLTPQAVHRMGGYRVQARTAEAVERLREDAHLLAGAGCFAIVLEGIPREVAAQLTRELTVPTIGIGAGPECDGQILVWHDALGINESGPKFVRRFAEAGALMREGLETYRAAVEAGTFPSDAESYHLPRGIREAVAV
jgi:3-methyl-2-oxobutanoate hydroxymethyltransferase